LLAHHAAHAGRMHMPALGDLIVDVAHLQQVGDRVQLGDIRARALAALDQPFGLELAQRAMHRHPRAAELQHQLALRRQAHTGLPAAFGNALMDRRLDGFVGQGAFAACGHRRILWDCMLELSRPLATHTMQHLITPGRLDKALLQRAVSGDAKFALAGSARERIDASVRAVRELVSRHEPVYGINTGFGKLAQTRIADDQLTQLQKNLVLSHSAGVGEPLAAPVVRLMLLMKAASLAHGVSGVRGEVIDALLALLNADVLPVVPQKGSVGASGDLAPLAHLSGVLLGIGEVVVKGERMSALRGLAHAGLAPFELGPKEGLALLNGTQCSTALAIHAAQRLQRIFDAAVAVGAMTVDAAKGSDTPFDDRIHAVRGQRGQREVAARYREWLHDSPLRQSHLHCEKVQDPYCLRCQPQVMGACLDQLRHAWDILLIEANGVSDNPLVFADTMEALSGGNFHAEPVAFAADNLALAIAEIGALSERRTAMLMDPVLSGLPAFLIEHGGLNSGFMIAQVTAAALASEN